MDLYLAGKVDDHAIDEWVDWWHANPVGQQLHEFLGMTLAEYGRWIRDPFLLREIARERRDGDR